MLRAVSATLQAGDYRDLGEVQRTVGAILTLGSIPALISEVVSQVQVLAGLTCTLPELAPPLGSDLVVTDSFRSGHAGVDYESDGDPVLFAGELGTVRSIGFQRTEPSQRGQELGLTAGGAGQYITVTHSDGAVTKYFHLVEGSTSQLAVGDTVRRGTVLGLSDATPAGGRYGTPPASRVPEPYG